MDNKLKIAILCGGRSPEHRISLISAQNVIQAIDKTLYEPILIGISKEGDWYYYPDGLTLTDPDNPDKITLIPSDYKILLSQNATDNAFYHAVNGNKLGEIDVIFPVLHGAFGEDGALQGLARMCNLPFVGCGVLASSMGMDKDITKKILRDAGIDVAHFVTISSHNKHHFSYQDISDKLGPALFLKPANLGSSVGVKFVDNAEDFSNALTTALSYDDKVLVEEKITGREIECAVLGNDDARVTDPGEIIPQTDFYTFENKYLNDDGALLAIPAQLSDQEKSDVKSMALATYRALGCTGLSRVDMFLCPDGRLLVNEINTIPGFTNISMYPKLWEHHGINQTQLITELIQLAIAQYKKEAAYTLSS